ncbi:receptor-like protein 4 [Nicotiana tomentosiformis]|uniref:receptor-like protein 4 n=1 Tax=Nicotiana tomentosiformis TaxID=4098 RepID=UPI00051C685C|nr:receptor-like protein 4 [Nicotiana tomentosiformis]
MLKLQILLFFFNFCLTLKLAISRPAPYVMRISGGARNDVRTAPTSTLWHKDFGYTGGIAKNATRPSFITPPLNTLRYFPLSEGPENCYNINNVPHGRYSVRIYFGLVAEPSFDNEPLFDVSVEGTLVYSLPSGWSNHDDERAFVETLVFLENGTASFCFHSTGHGDPAILAIEILQVDDKAYYSGPGFGRGKIFRTNERLSCGDHNSKFDIDYNGDRWGGDRFWSTIMTFGQNSDKPISTKSIIKSASVAPNFYPQALYQTALVSTDNEPDLTYTTGVDPNKNYSVWLHFAEIDPSVTDVGQRVVDISINGDTVFQDVDIVRMAGGINSAVVLNTTVPVNGRTLTITLHPTNGTHAIISAIEIFEVITAESRTSPEEVKALQSLKLALGLPLRFGWNGDPCFPQQHPWSGVDCQFDRTSNTWVIDGLGLDDQGLHGFLPDDVSRLRHLQSINLSGNSIQGPIPSALGTITSLEKLDFSYNFFNGSIPESLGQLTSLQTLNLNGNLLSGKIPTALGGRLLHRATFNFTDNAGLCGIPGLPTCGPHLTLGAKIGIGLGACAAVIVIAICMICWWKRRQNILRAQRIASRDAPYAKKRTHFNHIQMTRHHGHHETRHHGHPEHTRTAAENGPPLLT